MQNVYVFKFSANYFRNNESQVSFQVSFNVLQAVVYVYSATVLQYNSNPT